MPETRIKWLQNELTTLVNRGLDRHLKLAVTGLSRSGKTAFITAMVNQLLHIHQGARLPLFSVVREGRLVGVKRIPQRCLGVPRFPYDESMASLYDTPPRWPEPTRGVSEIQLALRFRSDNSLLRLKETSTLYLEIVDYPGEWLLDLPMLDMDYLTWSKQMNLLLQGERVPWAQPWLALCQHCDPLAPADENQLAAIAQAYSDYLIRCKNAGLHFIQPGRFILPGDMAGAPALQFFPWPDCSGTSESQLLQASQQSNFAMLRDRFNYYCKTLVSDFYQQHFIRFDRQIVLVDCLQALNNGSQSFNDMRLALSQLMQSFHYGKRTLRRRLFTPCIDKLMFAASKADHVTTDQHTSLILLLQQLIREAWQDAAFDGAAANCTAIASIQATVSGIIEHQNERLTALRGHRLHDGAPLTVFPGEIPSRLPGAEFWQKQGFHFEQFRPLRTDAGSPLPHIRMDAVMEFLLGDKLR